MLTNEQLSIIYQVLIKTPFTPEQYETSIKHILVNIQDTLKPSEKKDAVEDSSKQ